MSNATIDSLLPKGRTAPFLSKDRIAARPGFSRWLVPPAALAVHLCIGMAYGFSVFWLPLSRAVGVTQPRPCAPGTTLVERLFTTRCDWLVSDLGWIYTLFFVCLGSAAALWGGWLEREGPRKAGVVSAICWCGGLLVSALGVRWHQLWMLWLGSGVIGGIGLGLGYISPVSMLIKWFPDRRGMATGMAIMGFGGGAMIGAPLADRLMGLFRTASSVGVAETFAALGLLYFVFMLSGALGYRLPTERWHPGGASTAQSRGGSMITAANVALQDVHRTPQFWLIWAVLCLNVSAGIGVIGMASPMLQEVFGGSLIERPDLAFTQLDDAQKKAVAALAAGFTGLLSLFNIGGRFFWASLSDRIGRKTTYYVFFALGIALYLSAPLLAHAGARALFILALCVILSMYGGGFATVPAYLADMFGTRFVGAIHGRLLTAWSTAGIIGPVTVNYIREAQIAAGIPPAQAYDFTLDILAAMLVVGLVANALVKPVAARWHVVGEAGASRKMPPVPLGPREGNAGSGRKGAWTMFAWLAVGVPIAWGVWVTLAKALVLIR
jgi:MFS family permease